MNATGAMVLFVNHFISHLRNKYFNFVFNPIDIKTKVAQVLLLIDHWHYFDEVHLGPLTRLPLNPMNCSLISIYLHLHTIRINIIRTLLNCDSVIYCLKNRFTISYKWPKVGMEYNVTIVSYSKGICIDPQLERKG